MFFFQAELNALLAEAIYVSGSPLFEHPAWIAFFNKLRPSYRLPSRKVISTTLLDAEYEKMKLKIDEKLNESKNYNLQCDGWSNIRNESIINFIITQPKPVFVEFLATEENKHDTDYLSDQIERVLVKYGPEKFLVVIADNAANMQAAITKVSEKYPHIQTMGCSCHTFNLLCKDIVKTPSSDKVITNAKLIVNTIKRSHRLNAIFTKIQRTQKITCALKLPGETRWGSTLYCLESVQKNKSVLRMISVDPEASLPDNVKKIILDDRFWTKTQDIAGTLQPIVAGLNELQTNDCMIHKAYSICKKIANEVTERVQSAKVFDPNERKQILKALNERNRNVVKPIQYAGAILNPASMGSELNPNELLEGLEFIHKIANDMNLDTSIVMTDISHYRTKEELWSKQFI